MPAPTPLPIRGYCSQCGTCVWEGWPPGVEELIICTSCGGNCSRQPSLRYRLRWGFAQLAKRRRKYGLAGVFRLGIIDAFRLSREREVRNAANKARQAQSPTPSPR